MLVAPVAREGHADGLYPLRCPLPPGRARFRAGGALGLVGLTESEARKQKKACALCKTRRKGRCRGSLSDGTPYREGVCQAGAAPPLQDLAPGCRTMRHATALAGAWRGYATNYPTAPRLAGHASRRRATAASAASFARVQAPPDVLAWNQLTASRGSAAGTAASLEGRRGFHTIERCSCCPPSRWRRQLIEEADGTNVRREITCAPASSYVDICQQDGGRQQGDLLSFQPLGGDRSAVAGQRRPGSCGCTSHQQCADSYGAGAFCVAITGSCGTCGGKAPSARRRHSCCGAGSALREAG
jgi:hypothetical protein